MTLFSHKNDHYITTINMVFPSICLGKKNNFNDSRHWELNMSNKFSLTSNKYSATIEFVVLGFGIRFYIKEHV